MLSKTSPESGSQQLPDHWISYFLLFAFASGSLAHLWPAILPVTRYTTDPLLLVINGLVLFAIYRRNQDNRLWYWLFAAYWLTFFTEVAGVMTGAVFGEYAYGATMRWQWLNVPFVIALNWAMLTLAGNQLALRITRNPWLAAALAGALLALYDVAIEPVAIALDYWNWASAEVPLQNYLAWAGVAFLISLPLQLLRIRFQSPVLIIYFFAQLVFFLILNLGL
ncbi:hypothetical protein CEQ90_07635 [Lewinellaceae bacterium SD302]|nr:hypothetical protein CEQ90_07635 [Lewinellaceae bacterium SD302]